MFGSKLLGIVIGLVFVYLILSLFVTTLNEIVSTITSLRGKFLAKAVSQMLGDKKGGGVKLNQAFYKHPLIASFSGKKLLSKGKRAPSYLSASSFSKVVMDLLRSEDFDPAKIGGAGKAHAVKITQALDSLPEGNSKNMLLSLWADANGNIDKFKEDIEGWFDKTMERSTGWYKRRLKLITFMLAFGISVGFNADTFHIAKHLASDSEARDQVSALAANMMDDLAPMVDAQRQHTVQPVAHTPVDTAAPNDTANGTPVSSELDTVRQDSLLNQLQVYNQNLDSLKNTLVEAESLTGIGWSEYGSRCNCDDEEMAATATENERKSGTWDYIKCFLIRLLGWLVTALALGLGAPFWFDILKKVVNLRGSGKAAEAGSK